MTANTNVLRKVILLFRFEIQAALEQTKVGRDRVFQQNFYVRYRQILHPGPQLLALLGLAVFSGIGFFICLGVFSEEGGQPCLMEDWTDNKLVLGSIITAWLNFPPMFIMGAWSTRKLKRFPKDNWKIAEEGQYASIFGVVFGICAVGILASEPLFDKVLFLYFLNGFVMQLMFFLIPLELHSRMVRKLAKHEISQLTSLDRLLKISAFSEVFEQFLKSEFSTENMTFWKEVDAFSHQYRSIIPPDVREHSSVSTSESKSMSVVREEKDPAALMRSSSEQLHAAAAECIRLGSQYIGDRAPWQVNISSDAARDVEATVHEIAQYLKQNDNANEANEANLRGYVEDASRALLVAQHQVYQALKKDSYLRFLLTPQYKALEESPSFKRLLATEKLEQEVHASPEVAPISQNSRHSTSPTNAIATGTRKTGLSMADSNNPRIPRQTTGLPMVVLTEAVGAVAEPSRADSVAFPASHLVPLSAEGSFSMIMPDTPRSPFNQTLTMRTIGTISSEGLQEVLPGPPDPLVGTATDTSTAPL